MKEDLFYAHSCINCKHSYYVRSDDSNIAYYCNQDKTCPCKTQEVFNEAVLEAADDITSAAEKWCSSTRFCGYGDMCCNKWERKSK